MFRTTFTTVGLPYFNANVKKIVPTADPANPEKTRKAHVRARTFGISLNWEIKIGRNIISMKMCYQKTITFASNSSFSGIRHALSVPQSAAPRPTSHGPYDARRVLRVCTGTGVTFVDARVNEMNRCSKRCAHAFSRPRRCTKLLG